MKLAILSDTHGLLRAEVIAHLKQADAILHAGDINRQEIVDALRQYAPLSVVRGNNDKDWAQEIPHTVTVTLNGIRFFMVHNRKDVPQSLPGIDVVVFGHSHKYVQQEKDGLLWLNPGSCGPRRFHQEITMQQVFELLTIDAHGDVPFLGIPLKADSRYVNVLSRISMLSIQTADNRIFLPEMFFDDALKTVITIFCEIQHMRPSAACHDIPVMVQEVHVEVLVLVDSHRHLQLLVGLFIERKRAFRRKIQRHTRCKHR